jgi:hypothetical protein
MVLLKQFLICSKGTPPYLVACPYLGGIVMKQHRQPRTLTRKDYPGIDREVRNLVKLLNKVDGLATLDSCFGHTGDKKGHTNQLYTYIGLFRGDQRKFNDFFAFLLKHTYGGAGMVFLNRDMKSGHLDSGFSIGLNANLYPGEGIMGYQLVINPMTRRNARKEKLAGVAFLQRLIREYLRLGPKKAKKKHFGLEESLKMIRRHGLNPGVTRQYIWGPSRQTRESLDKKRKKTRK